MLKINRVEGMFCYECGKESIRIHLIVEVTGALFYYFCSDKCMDKFCKKHNIEVQE